MHFWKDLVKAIVCITLLAVLLTTALVHFTSKNYNINIPSEQGETTPRFEYIYETTGQGVLRDNQTHREYLCTARGAILELNLTPLPK